MRPSFCFPSGWPTAASPAFGVSQLFSNSQHGLRRGDLQLVGKGHVLWDVLAHPVLAGPIHLCLLCSQRLSATNKSVISVAWRSLTDSSTNQRSWILLYSHRKPFDSQIPFLNCLTEYAKPACATSGTAVRYACTHVPQPCHGPKEKKITEDTGTRWLFCTVRLTFRLQGSSSEIGEIR